MKRRAVTRWAVPTALATVVAAWATPASAQFTLRGGVNLSRFVGGDVSGSDSRAGLNFGGAHRVTGVGPFSVVLEGYYRQKGAEQFRRQLEAGGELPPNARLEFSLDYVEVPVLLNLDVPVPWRRVRPYFMAGPAFGWKLDCGVTVTEAAGAPAESCDDLLGGQETLEQTLRDYEQGMVLGGGLNLFVLGGYGALNLDGRLTRGLSRLSQGAGGPDVKNQSFTLMLGYSFGMGGSPGLRP